MDVVSGVEIVSAAEAASNHAFGWLCGSAWPLWLERGVDWKAGAFHEQLDLETLRCDSDFRRLRVAARQVYSFAQAADMGVPRAADGVAVGLDFLNRHARQEGGGYARCFDLAGRTIDERLCLYEQAFVLLALASADRRAEALALIDFIERRFAHPQGGYVESIPPQSPRLQNSHMHLLEACLAAADRFDESIFFEVAGRIVDLFATRFLSQADGGLPEFFNDKLQPVKDGVCYRVEPGHHCEWAWLLTRCSALGTACGRSCDELAALAEALMRFVDRHGINPHRCTVYDALWNDGTILTASSRLWPQTERLKAEGFRPAASARRVAEAYAALALYLDPAPPGLWREHLAADGSWRSEPAPASSLYHLTCGILETRAVISAKGW